jgi:hypothetical protein
MERVLNEIYFMEKKELFEFIQKSGDVRPWGYLNHWIVKLPHAVSRNIVFQLLKKCSHEMCIDCFLFVFFSGSLENLKVEAMAVSRLFNGNNN